MAEKGEEIGTVISTMEGPSPSQVDFVVSKGIVHRGQFVEIPYSEGKMICLVTDVIKTNRYFERAESVKEFESNGFALFDQFPVGDWEYLIAKTRPLGVMAEGGQTKRSTYPPGPGTKVLDASVRTLKSFLSFDEENGLHLGKLEYHNLEVKIGLSKLLQKHIVLLAQSGYGKSYLTSVLLEEILSRSKEQGRIATVLLDVHGEYNSFAVQPRSGKGENYSDRTRLVKGNEIKIGVSKATVGQFSSIVPGFTSIQKRALAKILSELKTEMHSGSGPFGLKELLSAVQRDESIKDNTKQALESSIHSLMELKLFAETDFPSFSDLIKPGTLTLIDLSDVIDMRKKQAIVSYLAHKMFYERRRHAMPPFLLVLEEAHQFVPEHTKSESAIARGIIETIAREGRKFGASLCLISQRPIRLSTTVLSQCGTHVLLRISNPYDLKHIQESSEGLDAESTKILTGMRVGEALMVGEATHYPVFFRVRQRKSPESSHEKTLEVAAREFEENSEEFQKEVEEFM